MSGSHSWKRMVGMKRPAFQEYVGRVVRAPSGAIVVIRSQTSFFVHERGIDQGYDDERGWVVELGARDAGDNEKALYVAREGRSRTW